eukprot:SAG11_NODE_510_length_8851_cov_25.360718_2_plen_152_part_00
MTFIGIFAKRKSDALRRWLADGGTAVSRRGRQGATEGGLDHRGRVNDYAFAHEFDDSSGLAALEEYERNGRKSVVGSETPTDSGRQGADGVRNSIVGDAGGGFAAGADSSGALEDSAFAEEVGEEEEETWTRALVGSGGARGGREFGVGKS